MKIYISGPITYDTGPDRFQPLAARLEDLGYEVLNPKTVPPCPDESCVLLPHEIARGWKHSWACFLKYDLVAMLNECDGILMMDRWQDSHGSRLELTVASAVGMTVLFEQGIYTLQDIR